MTVTTHGAWTSEEEPTGVHPDELGADGGFCTIASFDHAIVPPAALRAAVRAAKAKPDREGYYVVERVPINETILRIRVVQRSTQELERDGGDGGTMLRRYPSLDDVRIESRVWAYVRIKFPAELHCWRVGPALYLRQRVDAETWDALQPRMKLVTSRRLEALLEHGAFPRV